MEKQTNDKKNCKRQKEMMPFVTLVCCELHLGLSRGAKTLGILRATGLPFRCSWWSSALHSICDRVEPLGSIRMALVTRGFDESLQSLLSNVWEEKVWCDQHALEASLPHRPCLCAPPWGMAVNFFLLLCWCGITLYSFEMSCFVCLFLLEQCLG